MSYAKAITIAVCGVFAGLVLSAGAHVPLARANFFTDLLHMFSEPLVSSSPRTAATPPVPYAPTVDYERAVVNAVKRASPAVVSVTISKNVPIIENCTQNPFSDLPPEFQQFFGPSQSFTVPCATGKTRLQEVGGGSGFIISSDGLILTNKHVVADANASYTVFTNDGKKYAARVLARDPAQDLAVIKVDASGLPTLDLGDSSGIELGQSAIAIGNALGEYRNTVSVGVISGLARTVTASGESGFSETLQGLIQTDAAINPGNSGGPLLNLQGQVIGINTAIASGAQNIGFAIPINQAKRDITSVRTTGAIHTPYLGVRYTLIDAARAAKEHLAANHGALVEKGSDGPAVIVGSPAAKAGIRTGDILLSVDGQTIDADHLLGDIIAGHNVGDTVSVVLLRGGVTSTLAIVIGDRPSL